MLSGGELFQKVPDARSPVSAAVVFGSVAFVVWVPWFQPGVPQ